jgi:carboxyl-terminal processing protease
MIKGMLEAFDDPFTIFVEPIRTELTADSLQGRYGGIGVEFGIDENGYWVLIPFPENPAANAGIQEADRLIAVDGIDILPDTPLATIQAAIRGPVGEPVVISIARLPDLALHEYTIKREDIPLPSLVWHKVISEPTVGLIKVNLIAASTPNEILQAVAELQTQGVKFFIMDLRNNGGGLLEAGVDTARLFLQQGEIMQQQYRQRDIETFQVTRPGLLVDLPLVILVNQGTGSAAEIIAGALKAHGRAPLVGEPTYGKATLQLIFDLQDGSSMHVTSGRWWIPNLDPPLDGAGVQPDIFLPEDLQKQEEIIDAAIILLLRSE